MSDNNKPIGTMPVRILAAVFGAEPFEIGTVAVPISTRPAAHPDNLVVTADIGTLRDLLTFVGQTDAAGARAAAAVEAVRALCESHERWEGEALDARNDQGTWLDVADLLPPAEGGR